MQCVRAAIDPTGNGHCEMQFRLNQTDMLQWVEVQGRTLFDEVAEPRKPLRLEGTVVDITARKRASEALQASEERYRTLFDSIDEGFCIIEMLFDDTGKAIDYRFLEINRCLASSPALWMR